jgi:hypothetical protein
MYTQLITNYNDHEARNNDPEMMCEQAIMQGSVLSTELVI